MREYETGGACSPHENRIQNFNLKSEAKRPFREHRLRWKFKNIVNLKKIVYEFMD
jgi:hypothetical protein